MIYNASTLAWNATCNMRVTPCLAVQDLGETMVWYDVTVWDQKLLSQQRQRHLKFRLGKGPQPSPHR
jgi:hypothetical protein